MLRRLLPLLVLALWLNACGTKDGDEDAPDQDVAPEVAQEIVEDAQDTTPGDAAKPDTGPEVIDETLPALTEPVELRAGVAVRSMPAPIGIPISGNGPSGAYKTPYADTYPGTRKQHNGLTWKAIAFEGGLGRLVLFRGDLIGINATARQGLIERLRARTGVDFSDTLLFGATHTHSGPARMAQLRAWEMVQDTFFPEFYDRMLESMADTVIEAFEDLEPVRLGYGVADGTGLHRDRRCEDPDFDNPAMPVLRVERLDGSTKAVALVFAIHGTVIGEGERTLSQDSSGGFEHKLEERFEAPAPVLFFNSWAGDMAPGDPADVSPGDSPLPWNYVRIEAIGGTAADRVEAIFDDLTYQEGVVEIEGQTRWIPLSREDMGYPEGEFPYPDGAVYCGAAGDDSVCYSEPGGGEPLEGLDTQCISFSLIGAAAPDRTLVTAARIGDLHFITFPGEPVTELGDAVLAGIDQLEPGLDVIFLGYSQDYIGYSTPEYSWWLGGYEASGAVWGPKQGDYLTARIIDTMHGFLDDSFEWPWPDPGPVTLIPYEFEPLTPTVSRDLGQWTLQPKASYGPGELVEATFAGGDSWYGLPRVVLEREGESGFEPVVRPDGRPVDNHAYRFETELALDPPFNKNKESKTRTFLWTVRMATTRPVATTTPLSSGRYRYHVTGEARTGAGEIPYDSASDPFEISL